MALLRWQQNIVDDEGNVQSGAQVEIRSESSSLLVPVFEDRAGTTPKPDGNPFTADANGYAFAYVESGRFKITATNGAFSAEWRDVRLPEDVAAAITDYDADAATKFAPITRSRKNLLINGNFAINQRGYVSGAATSGANQYTLDRFRVVVSGESLTFSASGNGNEVTAPAGGIEQVIEGANIAGGTYTLSWQGTATATVDGTSVANGESVTLTADTNAVVRFSGGTVSRCQLEEGNTATDFEYRPIGEERALCERYAWVLSDSVEVEMPTLGALSSSRVFGEITFSVAMRTPPSVSVNDATTIRYRDSAGTATAMSTFTVARVGTTRCALDMSAGGAFTTAGFASSGTLSPPGKITFDAEL